MTETPLAPLEREAHQIATEVADACVYKRGTDNYARVWQGARLGARAALAKAKDRTNG